MICNVFKQRRRLEGELREAVNWSGRLRMPWEVSVSTVALNTTDKRIAMLRLGKLAEEREKEQLPPDRPGRPRKGHCSASWRPFWLN